MGRQRESQPGSILASVKYNPVRWFGVALRPEMVRRAVYSAST